MKIALLILIVVFAGCSKKAIKEQVNIAPVSHSAVESAPIAPTGETVFDFAHDQYTHVVFFAFDSDRLSGADVSKIREFVGACSDIMYITLSGGTCKIGTEEYNYGLGMRRALAVRDVLSGYGKIEVKSVGENDIISSEDALNRRCEIRVIAAYK
jgi:peptidoglycan-associated lipoprotein